MKWFYVFLIAAFPIFLFGRDLNITHPNGGELFSAGETVTVSWNTTGEISEVDLNYSVDAGATWSNITQDANNTGSFDWLIPSTLTATSSQCLVKVFDSGNAEIFDLSDGFFSIESELGDPYEPNNTPGQAYPLIFGETLSECYVSPGDAEYYSFEGEIGDTVSVVVEIESIGSPLTSMNFMLFSPVSAVIYSESSSGGDMVFTNILQEDGLYLLWLYTSTSSGPYTLTVSNELYSPDELMLTSPNGGESFSAGSSMSINWTSVGEVATVDLHYSVDGGITWSNIALDEPNSGNYEWTIPATLTSTSGQCIIKVFDGSDGTPLDQSDEFFSIESELGDPYEPNNSPGQAYPIIFGETLSECFASPMDYEYYTFEGAIGDTVSIIVEIESIGSPLTGMNLVLLTPEYGTLYFEPSSGGDMVFTSILQEDGVYLLWLYTFTGSGPYTLTANNELANSEELMLTSPNGGESFNSGTNINIAWSSLGEITEVDLNYSTDGGSTWSNIIQNVDNTGMYEWLIPATLTTTSSQCLISVFDSHTGNSFDQSDNFFTIESELGDPYEPNNTFAQAYSVNFSETLTEGYASPGDLEYFSFEGNVGDTVSFNVDLESAGSSLTDFYLTFYSPSFSNIYSETSGGNDMVFTQILTEAGVYLLQLYSTASSGSYYLTVNNLLVTDIDQYLVGLPDRIQLENNYPNPFNPSTTISFNLPEATEVKLKIFDIMGREIVELSNGLRSAGNHSVHWSGLDHSGNPVSTGVYFCRLQAGTFRQSIKMIYMK